MYAVVINGKTVGDLFTETEQEALDYVTSRTDRFDILKGTNYPWEPWQEFWSSINRDIKEVIVVKGSLNSDTVELQF